MSSLQALLKSSGLSEYENCTEQCFIVDYPMYEVDEKLHRRRKRLDYESPDEFIDDEYTRCGEKLQLVQANAFLPMKDVEMRARVREQ